MAWATCLATGTPGDDAGDAAAGRERGIGDGCRQADVGTTVHQFDAARGQFTAEGDSRRSTPVKTQRRLIGRTDDSRGV